MTFNHLAFFLPGQCVKDRAKLPVYFTIKSLAASLFSFRCASSSHRMRTIFDFPVAQTGLPERSKLFWSHWSNQWLTFL
jgi:hypothetical protein